MSELDENEANVKPACGNEVGYGKPPVASRFKPGQSGNPRGREKALGHMVFSYVRALKQPVRITKGTTEKNVSKEEAALRMMIEQSLQGDWKSFMALLKKGFKLGLIRRIQVPAFNSGVITLPFEYWHEKLAERPQAIREELARRNALWAKGLPYND
jgi:hypothetical protein